MKILTAKLAAKSIRGVFPYEFTYEDGHKGRYLPSNQMEYKGKFKPAQEVFEDVNGIIATKSISG